MKRRKEEWVYMYSKSKKIIRVTTVVITVEVTERLKKGQKIKKNWKL